MTNEQLYLAIGLPIILNTLFNGFMFLTFNNSVNRRFDDLRVHMNSRFDAVNQRFDDMRDLWRAELGRVEEVLDARLKHIEEGH